MRSGDRLTTTHLSPNIQRTSPRIAGRRDIAAAAAVGSGDSTGKPRFGTATKAATNGAAAMAVGQPRQCILHKGKKGFGFVLRGAKVQDLKILGYP
jgi:hypothetical protein